MTLKAALARTRIRAARVAMAAVWVVLMTIAVGGLIAAATHSLPVSTWKVPF